MQIISKEGFALFNTKINGQEWCKHGKAGNYIRMAKIRVLRLITQVEGAEYV